MALSGSLSKAGATVGEVFSEAKQINVTYDPGKVTVHQLVQAVAETEQIHPGNRYQAGLLVTIEEPAKSVAKVKTGLKRVKGVVDFAAVPAATDPGEIMIILAPLARTTKPADQVKASQIAEALEKNGVKFSGLPTGSSGTADADAKKKPGTKSTAKTKPGDDDTKPARPTTGTAKTRPTRDPASPPAKSKDDDSEEKPRFQILAGGSEKVFLVDHETKTDEGKELKKSVKEGDTFGDYVVKEVGNDDGLYVVLEHAETKNTIRVEQRKKETDKEGDNSKDAKEKDAGDKDSREKKKDKDAN